MRTLILLIALSPVLAVAAGEPEALREAAEAALDQAADQVDGAVGDETAPGQELPGGPVSAPAEPVIERPDFMTLPTGYSLGRLLGSFKLADRLDSHRDLFHLQLGAQDYDVSIAADAKMEVQYLSFLRAGALQLRRINNLSDLRGSGIVLTLDDGSTHRYKLSVNIFNPVRGSTLNITPEGGTRGPSHKIKTGQLLDRTKEESFVFNAGGKELWLQYGTDVDPATNQLATTRSFLFTHENGLSTKAWPVAESQLEPGRPAAVTLGDTRLVLLRTPEGELRIHEPGAGGASSAR